MADAASLHAGAPVPLSPAGPALSPIVAGAWRLASWGMSPGERLRWIERCLDLGVSSFDHADIYGGYTTEALFGEALALQPGLRQRLQLVSKCGIRAVSPQRPENRVKHYDSSPAHVRASVEASLRALRTDHLDLLLIHRPDALMAADDLADALDRLRQAGKLLHAGVSNHSPSQLALLHSRLMPLGMGVVTHQIEWSPLHLAPLADGTLDQCQQLAIRPMLWSPLAGGRLFSGEDERALRVRAVLAELGAPHGASVATVACAWLLRHPARPVPISGSRRIEALQEAVAALALPMSAEDWYRVLEASTGHPVA